MTTPLLMVKAGSRSSLSLCIPIVMLRPSHSAVVKETMIAARVVRAVSVNLVDYLYNSIGSHSQFEFQIYNRD